MQEDQLTVLPPEVRQMVMTGTTAMMNNAGNAGMMGPGVMMDMSNMNMMGSMANGMGMGMGMGGDMGMGNPMMQMQDGSQAPVVPNGAAEQMGGAMMQDGFNAGQGQGMMNMGMGGGEYGMQVGPYMSEYMY
jgi:pre-mRNA 3'-end-processing factor FIP1